MSGVPWKAKLSWLRRKLLGRRDSRDFLDLYARACYAEAFSVFKDTVEGNPRCLEMGDMYVLWADLELLVNYDAQRAQELLDTALEKGCADMAFYYAKRGAAFETAEQLEQAAQCYRKSVAEDTWVWYRRDLARVLSLLDAPEALTLWQQIVNECPESCVGCAFLSWEMAKSGDQDGAQRMEEKAQSLTGSLIDTYWVARLHHHREDFRNAIEWYLKAQDLGYGDKAVLNANIAGCYVSLGDAGAARAHLEIARKHDPGDKYVRYVQEEYVKAFGDTDD